MRDGRMLLVLSIMALSASCTLFVDTSGLVGGIDASDRRDAIAESSDLIVDAGADVSTVERCSDPTIIVCETFDGIAALDRYSTTTDPSTTIDLDLTTFVSPPAALRFVISPSGNESPDAVLRIGPEVSVADFSVDARLFIEYGEPGGVARLLYLSNDNVKYLTVGQSGEVLESGDFRAQLGAIPMGRWLSVHIEIKTANAPPTATIAIGDATAGPINLDVSWRNTGHPIFRFGVSEASSPTKGWLVRWDDVIVRKL